jgi:hypothetical protein
MPSGGELARRFCGGIRDTKDKTSFADKFGVLILAPGRPTPCLVRLDKIYDPISSHKNPSVIRVDVYC